MLAEVTQPASLSAEAANGLSQWQQWLTSSVQRLANASLLRSLHPVCTTLSPVEVEVLRVDASLFKMLCKTQMCSQVDLSLVALKEWLDSTAPSSWPASTSLSSQASQVYMQAIATSSSVLYF